CVRSCVSVVTVLVSRFILRSAFLFAFCLSMLRPPPASTLFPYTTLFRSLFFMARYFEMFMVEQSIVHFFIANRIAVACFDDLFRSEEHTSELQSRFDLVCRLLLEKKKRHSLWLGLGIGTRPRPASYLGCQ